jgi:mannose-6-phosphate isomerase-like protein (cupin superfamily)
MIRYKLRWLALVIAVCAVAGGVGGSVFAREADEPTKLVSSQTLAMGMPADAPGEALMLERTTLRPGGEISTHVHPGSYAIFVESGQFGFKVMIGEAILTRAGSSTSETIHAGAFVIAEPGDAIFENGGVVHSAWNPGEIRTVVLTAALLDAHEPSLQQTDEHGMPVAQQ